MNTITARHLGLANVDFPDLYDRHLCRHSQFGVNAAHLTALFGLWFAVYALLYWQLHSVWVPVAMAVAYLAVMVPNLPARVTAVTALFLAAFVAAVVWVPELPFWAYLVMVPVFYKL